MLDFIFFTTNKIKLAHARYMAEKFPIKIESFRERTYHASYTEPRISSREQLLELSYTSALDQLKKAKIEASKHFFFLEDTSVIISALSTGNLEVPGVEVKYWMQGKTFASIDSLLKEKGNDRRVTVRSDIILHVPEPYRSQWSLDRSYLSFTGFQPGEISSKDFDIKTNLVFPWLDNKTFNKWFVPDGAILPISLLDIESANKGDFRRNAFFKMVEYLKEKGLLLPKQKQKSFALDKTPVLIVCGFTCAGKTTIAQHLVRKYGYVHIEASDFMHLNYYLRHDISSGVRIRDFAEEALRVKPEIAAEKIVEYMDSLGSAPVIISGFRSPKEIEWLKAYYKDSKAIQLVYVDASENIRFQRHNARKRDGEELNAEQFKERDDQQVRMGLSDIAFLTDKITVTNEDTLNEFYSAFENGLLVSQKPLPKKDIDLTLFKDFSESPKMEDAILIALLSKWKNDENRDYFTTTEIAKIINEIFLISKPKHKDNVSRHFNRDFYPTYEIQPTTDESKIKYRLSNTGYGTAVQVYHDLINRMKL